MSLGKSRRAGSVMIEFTFIGIPMIFLLISIFEMARGMWLYHTLAYAIKEGARFAMVHGHNCDLAPNSCVTTVADVAQRIQDSGVGLIPEELQITFESNAGLRTCTLKPGCLADASRWPPNTDAANAAGLPITIYGNYPFRSAISMFWPGAGNIGGGSPGLAYVNFTASSRETIQF